MCVKPFLGGVFGVGSEKNRFGPDVSNSIHCLTSGEWVTLIQCFGQQWKLTRAIWTSNLYTQLSSPIPKMDNLPLKETVTFCTLDNLFIIIIIYFLWWNQGCLIRRVNLSSLYLVLFHCDGLPWGQSRGHLGREQIHGLGLYGYCVTLCHKNQSDFILLVSPDTDLLRRTTSRC